MVPYDRPHVMDGVVGTLLTARRLLDAAERRIVGEHVLAVLTNRPGEGASRFDVAGENIIKNLLDICVVYVRLTVRVEILHLCSLRSTDVPGRNTWPWNIWGLGG